jgi:serine protease AprX
LLARALDKDGAGTYSDVINAIQWVIANQARYNVRVLNLSLYASVEGPYWADPLAQAVMRAWQAGIVVVVAAGNLGPDAGSISVPGNVPYVITVGAIKSGRYTTSGNDELAYYSSRGPTESAFVKPDVLIPASRTIAPMPDNSTMALQLTQECGRLAAAGSPQPCIETKADVDYGIGKPSKKHSYFYLSGTSMAAAEVSGIVALVLQANPTLTNDAVKYRLLATARPALDQATGQVAYSAWEQGAGLVDAQQAVGAAPTSGVANAGMDIGLDLTSNIHYSGYTTWNDPPGEFRLVDPVTGQPLAVWDGASKLWGGASKLWGGASKLWGGASKLWGGASKLWGGGTNDWTAGASLWAGADRFWASSTASTPLSKASHAGILVSDNDPAAAPTGAVYPIAECVVDQHNGTYTAYFGYQNDNALPVTLLLGANNHFSPDRRYRGQPTTFMPGRGQRAFSVDFSGSNLVWTVNGLTAAASSASAWCGP